MKTSPLHVVVALLIGVGLGALGMSVLGSTEAVGAESPLPDVTDSEPVANDKPCPRCLPAAPCPKPRAEVRPRPQKVTKRPVARSSSSRDRALRWPADVPREMTPEFVRDVLKRARAACPDLPPLVLDCRGFPCALVAQSPRKARLEDLAKVCPTLAELGKLRSRAYSSSSEDVGVKVFTQEVGDSHTVFEGRSQPLRDALARSGEVERLYCEQEGDANACGRWGAKLVRSDLDEAMKVSQAACEDGAGEGCAVMAMLGTDVAANFQRACELGDADGCRGIVATLCADEEAGCTGEALKYARRLREVLEEAGSFSWNKQRALQTEGKVLCASGDPKAGLALLQAGCLDGDGNKRRWCDPQGMCAEPRFSPPTLR